MSNIRKDVIRGNAFGVAIIMTPELRRGEPVIRIPVQVKKP